MGRPYPPPRPFSPADVRALTAEEASAFDARAIERVGVPQPVLMENAGRAAAAVLQRLYPTGPVVGLVGAGNNGGDALVALRTLRAWGRDARAVLVADRPEDDPLLHGWPLPVVADGDDPDWDALLDGAAVLVDGVLGTGVRGAPRARQAAAIEAMNASAGPVLAIDVPSGIDASTGAVPGAAVRAHVTVSFGAPKLGALLHPAAARVGRHVVVEIGFPPLGPDQGRVDVVTPTWAGNRLPRRGSDTHKNAVGRVLVVAGRVGMGGAAILSARGAFRSGAGLVRVASVPENRSAIHSALPEAVFVDVTDAAAVEAALQQADALAVGPGLGTDAVAEDVLDRLLTDAVAPVVADADALNLLAARGEDGIREAVGERPVLLTPHPGEMGRLRPDRPDDAVATVREAAECFACSVLLKGAPSLVARPDGRVTLDTQSSSDLAVAGMGDVLTGVCAGLVAQGLTPATAGAVGLYLTGRSARLAGRGPALTPSDVLRWLPEALTERSEPIDELGLPFVLYDADPAR